MSREETRKILQVIKAGWPHSFNGKTIRELTDILNLWADMFQGDDARLVGAAVKALLASGEMRFAPSIGEVKAKMRLLTAKQELDEAEAWSLVAKAISNSGYEAKKEFDRLPEPVQRIVGSPNQLRDWAMMDSDIVHSVVASNFQRAFRTRQAAAREYAALPADVKAVMLEMGSRLALEDRNHAD